MTQDIDKLVARAKEVAAQRETISHDAYGAQKALRLLNERDELIATLAKRLEEAEAVIRPFAEAAASYDPPEGDDQHTAWAHDFPIGSLRAARRWMEGK